MPARAQISRKPNICILVPEKQYQRNVWFQMAKFYIVTLINLNIFALRFAPTVTSKEKCLTNLGWEMSKTNSRQTFIRIMSIQISAKELDKALKECQTSTKSSDPDGIHPLMLRHTGTFFKIACLKLFNLCLHAGTYIWNLGKVIFIWKPHKEDNNIANSYRPNTLTPYVAKLFERIIEKRLRNDLEAKGLIDDSQEGFRKRRGTGRCNYKLIGSNQNNIGQKSSGCSFHRPQESIRLDLDWRPHV